MTNPESLRIAPHSVNSDRSQPPALSHTDLLRLSQQIAFYSVHPAALQVIDDHLSFKKQSQVNAALEVGQNEFLIVKLPRGTETFRWTVDALHQIRSKEAASDEKIEGLWHKGYMVVHEPAAIRDMKQFLPTAYRSTEPAKGANRIA